MKWLLFNILLVFHFSASAQTSISGKVTGSSKNPLAGVSITLVDTYDGATTDSIGNFSFTTSETGTKTLEFTSAAYEKQSVEVVLEGKPIQLDMQLKDKITELNAVTITAGSFEAGDKKRGTVLSSLDVVTTASSNGDVTAAIKTLPGAQQVGENEGLFVRGGTATETKIFIDGNLVNNFFYSTKPGIASRGRFNPFLFKGTQFSAGGYSALYGQALSSALILETTDIAEQSEGSLALSVIGVGGGIQQLAKNKKSSWGASYNFSHLQPVFQVIKQRQDFTVYPQFHDADLNFRIKTKNGLIKYYGYGSLSKMEFREADIDSAALKNKFYLGNTNFYHNLNWRENVGNGWKLISGLSFSNNKDDIRNTLENAAAQKQAFTEPEGYFAKNFMVDNRANYAQVRIVAEKKSGALSAFRFGGEHFISNEKLVFTDATSNKYHNSVNDNLIAAFGEWDVYIGSRLAIRPGLRGEYSKQMDQWNLAPRFSVAYKLKNAAQLSFAYGKFYQNPESKYLPLPDKKIGFAEATHYMLQYQMLTKNRVLRGELFYKQYDHLYKTSLVNGNATGLINNNGKGNAKGIEVFWRNREVFRRFDYWVSYSYLDTKRDYLYYPGSIVPDFAAKHTASLVVKSFYLPLKAGMNVSYTYASGRPYYQFRPENGTGKIQIQDQGHTKSFNNISASINYLPWLGQKSAKSYSVLVLMVNNVFGFKNVFNYQYGAISGNKRAVLPTSDRFIFLGWFMSFGADRTQDAINNNL